MNNNKFDYNKITSYYPYGELPLKYTKQGQAQLKRELENNSSSAFFNTTNKFYNGYNNTIKNNKQNTQLNNVGSNQINSNNNNNEGSEKSTMDKILTQKQDNASLDFNSVLPLLSNFGGNSKIKDLIPLLSKGGNLGMNDLIKLFSSMNKTKASETKTKLDDGTYINNLKKVE